jgi:hypothetical protein
MKAPWPPLTKFRARNNLVWSGADEHPSSWRGLVLEEDQ